MVPIDWDGTEAVEGLSAAIESGALQGAALTQTYRDRGDAWMAVARRAGDDCVYSISRSWSGSRRNAAAAYRRASDDYAEALRRDSQLAEVEAKIAACEWEVALLSELDRLAALPESDDDLGGIWARGVVDICTAAINSRRLSGTALARFHQRRGEKFCDLAEVLAGRRVAAFYRLHDGPDGGPPFSREARQHCVVAVADFDAVLSLSTEGPEAEPARSDARLDRANALGATGAWLEAIADYDAFLAGGWYGEEDLEYLEAFAGRAAANAALGQHARAVADYEAVISTQGVPDIWISESYVNRAMLLAKLGQHKAALEDFDAAVIRYGGTPDGLPVEALRLRGDCYAGIGELAQARESWRAAKLKLTGQE